MLKKLITLGVICIIGAVLMSGCATPQTMNAPGNTTLGTTAMGGLGGAAIGAAVDKKHGRGALLGGTIGALSGALVGQQMEKNRDQAIQQQQGAYSQGYADGSQGAPPPPPPRTY